jgi:hypothetical protein
MLAGTVDESTPNGSLVGQTQAFWTLGTTYTVCCYNRPPPKWAACPTAKPIAEPEDFGRGSGGDLLPLPRVRGWSDREVLPHPTHRRSA